MAIIEEFVQVRGLTDVEGWVLRDKVWPLLWDWYVQREDGAGWEVLLRLEKLCGMELLLLFAEC